MALSLRCQCGVRFEVEDALAGQSVACPECQQTVEAPSGDRPPLRTSGWALGSFVTALVLAFTGIGSFLAVMLGMVALIDIARNRERVAGTGYAIFGIVVGILCTGIFAFAVTRQEIIGGGIVREQLMGAQVDRSGPMEVDNRANNFHITRPSASWGVAKGHLAEEWNKEANLVLVHLGWTAYVDVTAVDLEGKSLEAFRKELVEAYKEGDDEFKFRQLKTRKVVESEKRQVTDKDGHETAEVRVEVKDKGHTLVYWIRIVRQVADQDRAYVLRGGGSPRSFSTAREEIRKAFDSFRFDAP